MSNFRLRLWRRIRVAPGVTLNLSNRGVSTSLGVRGAHLTVGRRGVRQTVGLPGSGLYLTRQTPYGARQGGPGPHIRQAPTQPFNPVTVAAGGFLRGILWVLLGLGALAAFGALIR